MMALIFYMFALMFVQGTVTFLNELAASGELEGKLQEPQYKALILFFGNVEEAMLSLFKATTGGDDWSRFYDMLRTTGITNTGIFVFFVAFSQVALMNILTGLFVEQAMKLAEPDREALFLEKRKAELRSVQELAVICNDLDVDGNGYISEEEFLAQIQNVGSKLRTYMGALGLDKKDAELFFWMLKSANFNMAVEIRSFVAGLVKLKGGATSLDMQALVFQTRIIHRRLDDLATNMGYPDERHGTIPPKTFGPKTPAPASAGRYKR
jgi:hypothetical protein